MWNHKVDPYRNIMSNAADFRCCPTRRDSTVLLRISGERNFYKMFVCLLRILANIIASGSRVDFFCGAVCLITYAHENA